MNDSTFAFNFTRNYLQVHEDSLTVVNTSWTVKMCIDKASLITEPHPTTVRKGRTCDGRRNTARTPSKWPSILQKWSRKKTHRFEPWSSECVSTRFVMERSHGYGVPQLSVAWTLLVRAAAPIGEHRTSLLCADAGEGSCVLLLWVRGTFSWGPGLQRGLSPCHLLQFQRPLSKADALFLGLIKPQPTNPRALKANRNQ